MAHFAKLGINGKVIAGHVVNDTDLQDADGVQKEAIGQQFLERNLKELPDTMSVRMSDYHRIRTKYDTL